MRFATLILASLVTFSIGCRTGHIESNTSKEEPKPKSEVTTDTASTEPEPAATALRRAVDEVETARLLALPLEPLSADVMQGFALPLYAELPGLNYEQMLSAVRSSGSSHVSIIVSWDQRTIYANTIRPNVDKGPSDERVGEVIAAARAQGLKVMLFPIIHVKLRNDGEWRGKMAPEDLDRWKEEYRSFILHYARLSQRHDVDIFSVGSELGSLEAEETFWRDLIASTREAYDGRLIYSANWDHYTSPQFWDELDYIGVSSYFEIADVEGESVVAMTRRWRTFRDEMIAYARAQEKQLVMTEVGYPSMPSAATKPWDYTKKSDADLNAQLAAFRAMSHTWTLEGDDVDHFAGLFVWHAWGAGGQTDSTYTVWGKPTERFIDAWFAR